MQLLPNPAAAAGCQPAAGPPTCPRCRGDLLRVRRRPVDHITSWLVPARRYRCVSFNCQWEGNFGRHRVRAGVEGKRADSNLGLPGEDFDGSRDMHTLPKTFVISLVLSAIGVGFILVATGTDWLEPPATERYLSSEDTWRSQPAIAIQAKPAIQAGASVR